MGTAGIVDPVMVSIGSFEVEDPVIVVVGSLSLMGVM